MKNNAALLTNTDKPIEITILLRPEVQEALKIFIEKETKVRRSIAEDCEKNGNFAAATSLRRELSLKEWVYMAFLNTIGQDIPENKQKG